jgi:hypothetical protein
MKKTVLMSLGWFWIVVWVCSCNRKPSPDVAMVRGDTVASHVEICSTDDTLTNLEADLMIAKWDSITAGLHINNRVSIMASYLAPLLQQSDTYPTLRIYLGLIPTEQDDSLNIGLIATQVDTNCNDRRGDENLLLFTGTSGDSSSISQAEARTSIERFVQTMYGLPEFEGWPKVHGYGFSVAYITSILGGADGAQKIQGDFAIRSFRCEEVGVNCVKPGERVDGIDVILRELFMEEIGLPKPKRVAVNFSVPCPRFCGNTSIIEP